MFLDDYFDDMAMRFKNFKFIACLSKPDDSWMRECGHITELVKHDQLDGLRLAAYVCGNPNMLVEAVMVLKELGVPEERIYREAYG